MTVLRRSGFCPLRFVSVEVCILFKILKCHFVNVGRPIWWKICEINTSLVCIPSIEFVFCHYEFESIITRLLIIFVMLFQSVDVGSLVIIIIETVTFSSLGAGKGVGQSFS